MKSENLGKYKEENKNLKNKNMNLLLLKTFLDYLKLQMIFCNIKNIIAYKTIL